MRRPPANSQSTATLRLHASVVLILLALLLAPPAVRADVYKCPDGKGGTTYTNSPCVDGRAPVLVSPPSAAEPAVVERLQAPRPSTDERLQAALEQVRALNAQEAAAAAPVVQTILASSPPADYAMRLDAAIARSLKDPASRQVELWPPVGSAVCGTVNAKNSFGGYTGPQIFLSTFDARGQVEVLRIYATLPPATSLLGVGLEGQLLTACGVKLR